MPKGGIAVAVVYSKFVSSIALENNEMCINNTELNLSSRHRLFVNALKCTMTMYVEQTKIAKAPSGTFVGQRQERNTVAAAVAVKPVRNIQQIH